jgi:hypothetical protein
LDEDISSVEARVPRTITDQTVAQQSGEDVLLRSYAQQVERALSEWRARIDELSIQLDLAYRDIRDEAHERLDATRNVYLAARSRLPETPDTSDARLNSLVLRLEHLMRDLTDAYRAAEAAVGRSCEQTSVYPHNHRARIDHDSH